LIDPLKILSKPFRALIIGSSGTIGSAFVELLQNNPLCQGVVGIHRNSNPPIDYLDSNSIEACAKALSQEEPFQLIINTIGVLHSDNWMPEKRLDDLNEKQLAELMQINAIGPALSIRHFSKLLDPQGSVMVSLSAKVGSIEDNRLGGWYSYRSSKAALNMLIKTASIEFARTKPNVALIAMHPGTVNSNLSRPFRGQEIGRPALEAAVDMLRVIENIEAKDSGSFLSYAGEKLPW
jgi:NAD(P)-dependent dehydrogenase (short-subunit alcohol dehydrogenase family)